MKMKIQPAASWDWLARLVQRHDPKMRPSGPCIYCGEPSDNEFEFRPGEFAHKDCLAKWRERRKAYDEERKQIELIKTAIREIEEERLNDDVARTEGEKDHE